MPIFWIIEGSQTGILLFGSYPDGLTTNPFLYRYSDNYLVPFRGLSLSDWLF